MERLSLYLADKMYQNQIIKSDDKSFYSYSIQLLLERTIGIFLICFFAAVLKNLIEVFLFLVVFAFIRRYSDGIHCKTSTGCFISSVLMSLSTIPVTSYIMPHLGICQGGLIISMIIVFCVGTIRNPDLGLTPEEFVHLRVRSRITVLSVGSFVLILTLLLPHYKYVSFMALGVIYNALSLVIVKILREEVTDDEKTEARI